MFTKCLPVYVDRASWGAWPFPPYLTAGESDFDVDVSAALLMLGVITIPDRCIGISLSEYWAWIRYFSTLSRSSDLKIIRECDDLDPHQKTILSDDFGVAFSVYWCWKNVGFSSISDGKYFVDQFRSATGAQLLVTPSKNGAAKLPDFVCRKDGGASSPDVYHVIECKGTQSGYAAREKQIERASEQKITIGFPRGNRGETLACGLLIGMDGGPHHTELLVSDPELVSIIDVDEEHLDEAAEVVGRGQAAKFLAAAGFRHTSAVLACPDGGSALARLDKYPDSVVQSLLDKAAGQRLAAELEISGYKNRPRYDLPAGSFFGREMHFELPEPVRIGDKLYKGIFIRYGVNADFLGEIRLNDPSKQGAIWTDAENMRICEELSEDQCRLSVGNTFDAMLQFLR